MEQIMKPQEDTLFTSGPQLHMSNYIIIKIIIIIIYELPLLMLNFDMMQDLWFFGKVS